MNTLYKDIQDRLTEAGLCMKCADEAREEVTRLSWLKMGRDKMREAEALIAEAQLQALEEELQDGDLLRWDGQ